MGEDKPQSALPTPAHLAAVEVVDMNRTVKDTKGEMDKNNINIQHTLKTIKDDELAEKIDKWLAAPDNSGNYNEAHDKRQENTCSWFIEGSRFRELQEKGGFLWIKGNGGCGKTILCSSVIDKIVELQEKDASVNYAYFFFDGRDSQNDLQLHDKLVRALIWQLSLQCNGIPAALVELYGHGHQQPSTSLLEETLHHIINGLHSTYIVIDSINECTEQEKTLRWIDHIVSRNMSNLRVVVTSRPERDISDSLQILDPQCIDLVNEPANDDIIMYLEQEVSLVEKWDEETRKIVQSKLKENAQGMFQWITLQLIELQKCSSRRSVTIQLNNPPKSLYETYDRILSKIGKRADRTDVKTFLRWLCFSVRPMTLVEIAESMVVDLDKENGPQYTPGLRYWDEQDVMEKCTGFITETNEGHFKLAHVSIKEYLLSEHCSMGATSQFWHMTSIKHSHFLMAQICLVYLLHIGSLDLVDENVDIPFPIAHYAAEQWIFYAQSGGIDTPEPLTLALAKKLFTSEKAWFNWVRLWNLDDPRKSVEDREQSDIGSPLYYAASAGLEQLSLQLMEDGNVNKQGGYYGNALQAAAACGHEGIVKGLLEKGADVNAQGGCYSNALLAASTKGHEEIAKLLLQKGAEVSTSS